MVVRLKCKSSKIKMESPSDKSLEIDPKIASANTTGFKIGGEIISSNPMNPVPNTFHPGLNVENLPSNFVKKKNFTFNRKGKKLDN